jgi:hypothetical protein
MEFGAKILTKFTHAIRNWGVYVLQKCVIEVVLECFCPAKMHHPKRFLEKSIGQECPATIRLGGLGKWKWKKWILRLPFEKDNDSINGFYLNH